MNQQWHVKILTMGKVRVDVLLVEQGLAQSRAQAQRLVMAGQVRAGGQVVLKPSVLLAEGTQLTVEQPPRYVSRGGEKLAAALERFPIHVSDKVCADVGASTGGFTDCLLQHGAMKVFAIDVGQGILHWNLRQDPRVIVLENTNARYLEQLPEPIDIVTIDASFISLKLLLPVVKNWVSLDSEVVALVKPQFEAGRRQVAKGDGVIRDKEIHRQVLLDVFDFAQAVGFEILGAIKSPLLGPKGNVEFLAWLRSGTSLAGEALSQIIERCLTEEISRSPDPHLDEC
jgi:23S rRNA (cytidine1920-2'-O)/16S rRNA (cytidine1409-2'-O)-methyltransferase